MFGLLATAVNTAPTYHFGSNSFLLGFSGYLVSYKSLNFGQEFHQFSAHRTKDLFIEFLFS